MLAGAIGMTADETRLPLFPLRAVLFPGGELRLRIFEARYLDLVRDCLRDDRAFGVVRITEGREVGVEQGAPHIAVVGTTARLMDADVLPGGLLGVRVLGERRFRVLAHEPDRRGLLWARVEKLVTDLSSDGSIAAERRERLVAALARLEPALQAAGARHELPWLCHRLAERLPLDLAVRQALLECESVAEMVARVEDWLASTQR